MSINTLKIIFLMTKKDKKIIKKDNPLFLSISVENDEL